MTALTEKYRPRKLSQLVGQRAAVKVVSGMLDKGLPPTILLSGPHSTGKTTIARIIAKRANCSDPNGPDACGKCPSCTQNGKHPDVMELNAAEDRGIDTIRRLQQVAKLAPRFKERFVIMDECHALTPQAFQAGLKLFEEPPRSCHFLLVTTDPQKMPQTILSRCSPVTLRPIDVTPLGKFLRMIAKREGLQLKLDEAETLAEVTHGHPREALHLLQQVLNHPDEDLTDIDAVIRKVSKTAPQSLVTDFVIALFDCKQEDCFSLYEHIEVPDRFIQSVVELLQAIVRYAVDKKLVGGYHERQAKKIGTVKLKDAADLLQIFGEALQQAKSYLMPADVVLDLAVVKATT